MVYSLCDSDISDLLVDNPILHCPFGFSATLSKHRAFELASALGVKTIVEFCINFDDVRIYRDTIFIPSPKNIQIYGEEDLPSEVREYYNLTSRFFTGTSL